MPVSRDDELFYKIALTKIANIGDKLGRQLFLHFGSAAGIFNASPKQLAKVGGFGQKKLDALRQEVNQVEIESEMDFITKYKITPLFFDDIAYPEQLKTCIDAPLMLYYKGSASFKQKKMVAIIGSRENTEYGAKMAEDFIDGLKGYDITVVSGLAFGIDVVAHRKALQVGLQTIGVLGHGLDTIYPIQHKHVSKEMVKQGGLLTEYPSGTNPDRYHFPMRNRIVAGMCDATIVIETAIKGGAMITAKLAASYNKEVGAFPGRITDKKSEGCNYLIKTNLAHMITCTDDFLTLMNWNKEGVSKVLQPKLFHHLTDQEMAIVTILEGSEGVHIDELLLKSKFNPSTLSSVLLTLELGGTLKALPGKRFRLC